jgi:soluble lytic murein transglycosylase-like protein
MDAVVHQESHGRAGALGPVTKYGQAQGLAQTLPGTAHDMATRLGVPWRPELLTAKTEEAAAYQRKLGAAYLTQAYEQTGNLRDALRYYHGGPDRRLWGPKTNAYADAILKAVRQ